MFDRIVSITTWNNEHSINHYFFSANSSSSSPIVLTDELSGTGSTESISDIETDIDHFHRVNINTHGRKLNLELSPIQHLLSKRSAFENTWFADAYPNNVSYTPSPKVSKIYKNEIIIVYGRIIVQEIQYYTALEY